MNQEKIGKLIKEIRTKNNLTQKDLADKYGVTYQAVSKWENGKNIPDIMILQQMSKDFNIDITSLLEGEAKQKKNYLKYFIAILLIIILSITLYFILSPKDNKPFEFKTLSTTCSSFTIKGTVAYNKAKTSIHITNIEYCGGLDDKKYTEITCRLLETEGDTTKVLNEVKYNENAKITLEDYLKEVEFKINDYTSACKIHLEHPFVLEIEGTEENGQITHYDVPLTLEECN